MTVSRSTRVFLSVGFFFLGLFNLFAFFYFRHAVASRIDDSVDLALSSLQSRFDVLQHNLQSNILVSVTNFVGSFPSFSSSSDVVPVASTTVISPVVDTCSYDFYERDGVQVARIGSQDFSRGSPYPRGGVIFRVYEDCIILEGGYRVQNASRIASNRFLDKTPTEISRYDRNAN